MDAIEKTQAELLAEIADLRDRLNTSEETLRAIQQGEVDALVITTAKGTQIFTLQNADQSYRLLVEEMQQGAVILSNEGLILYCNKSFSTLLRYPLETIIGSYFQRFLSSQDSLLFQSRVAQTEKGTQSAIGLFLIPQNAIEIPVYLSITQHTLDDVCMHCVVITDLTEQRRYEQTLAAERLARLILEQAGEAIIVCDHTGQIIRASQSAGQLWESNLLFQPFDQLTPLYQVRSKDSLLSESDSLASEEVLAAPVAFSIQSVLAGKSYQGMEVDLNCPNGQVLNLILNARPLADQSNHFRGAVVILTDITRQKQAELALRNSQLQLKQQLAEIETIYQSAPIGLNVLDSELRFVRINQRLAEINGYSVEAHIGRSIRELCPDLVDPAEQLLRSVLETGNPLLNVEITGETPAQPGVQRVWLESFLPIKDGDRIIGINTVCEEITERKRLEVERQQTEEALRQAKNTLESRVAERTIELHQTITELQAAEARIKNSLREKEVLLQEIHHRVKNNLGIVSSLLQMQIRRMQGSQAASVLQDSQNRIASIALVHEKLYRSKDLANINCDQYIQDLTIYLFDSYNISSTQIQLNVQVENVQLDVETMIPCGLIINELVSNALKHAFPNDHVGKVQVKFFQSNLSLQEKCQTISTLIVQDNGVGLPADFDIKQAKTLGLTLVQGLAKQIGATIEVFYHQGTEFKLTFTR